MLCFCVWNVKIATIFTVNRILVYGILYVGCSSVVCDVFNDVYCTYRCRP